MTEDYFSVKHEETYNDNNYNLNNKQQQQQHLFKHDKKFSKS